RRRRQHHQERSAVADPRAPGKRSRRAPCEQARRTGQAGARVQPRFPGVEEGLRAEEALPGAHQDALPARRHPVELPQGTRPRAPPRVLVRKVPEAVSVEPTRGRLVAAAAAPTSAYGGAATFAARPSRRIRYRPLPTMIAAPTQVTPSGSTPQIARSSSKIGRAHV